MKQHFPSIAGVPVVHWEGDTVRTRDGRQGTVLGYTWENDLVIWKDGMPSKGFFIVTVDFGNHTERFLRHDLSGKRFGNEWI
ncbi:MAG: hypothetical protein KGI10_00335 [Thaumarchaeota archaeon]|nr:hypothetical protein [Nitrososphaerota archaeon]